MDGRSPHRDIAKKTIEQACRDRSNAIDAVRVASKLEAACYNAIRRKESLREYFGMCAVFIAHISPHLYVGRHSFYFRDLLIVGLDDSVSDVTNIALFPKQKLWPEIYDNINLTQPELKVITEIRTIEISLVYSRLNDLLKSESPNFSFSTSETKTQQHVCMGENSSCWTSNSSEVHIGPNICLPYENFLFLFAANDMHGPVADPSDDNGLELDPILTRNIRKLWRKELCMARVYLAILR